MKARTISWEPTCEHIGCYERATHSVWMAVCNDTLGRYCERHADERTNAINGYNAAVSAAITGSGEVK